MPTEKRKRDPETTALLFSFAEQYNPSRRPAARPTPTEFQTTFTPSLFSTFRPIDVPSNRTPTSTPIQSPTAQRKSLNFTPSAST